MPFDAYSLLFAGEYAGVFDIVLPFLLLFAVVFGILNTTGILGHQKGVQVIISLVIGLLALRLPFVRDFFANVFPRMGVALAVIIVLVILTAMFIPSKHKTGWLIGFYAVGGIAALFVIFNSFSAVGFFGTYWWDQWGAGVIGALLIAGVIIAVAVSGGKSRDDSVNGDVIMTPFRVPRED